MLLQLILYGRKDFIFRSVDDINKAEKVLISGNKLLNQNIDNLEDSVDTEFIGLLTFKSSNEFHSREI